MADAGQSSDDNSWWVVPLVVIGLLVGWSWIQDNGGNNDEPEAPPPAVNVLPGPSRAPSVVDLDCSDVGGPVAVGPSDPHGLDADNDGVGCE